MGFLQVFTVGFTVFLALLVVIAWLGWSKPGPGTDYRKEFFTALMGIESLLIGAFVQEFRVQDQAQLAAEARQEARTLSSGLAQLEGLTTHINLQARTARDSLRGSQAVLDSIRLTITRTTRAAMLAK